MSRVVGTKLFLFSLLTAMKLVKILVNEAGIQLQIWKIQHFYFHIDFIVDNVFQILVFAKIVQQPFE